MKEILILTGLCAVTVIGFLVACIIVTRSAGMPDIEDLEQ